MSAMVLRKLTNHQLQNLLPLSFLAAYAILLVRTAWMCDDAFITLRTVDNFVQGYGLVWNVGERVQVYTHPLWMFLLSAFYAFTREPYFTTLAISMALSLATVVLLLWTGRRHFFTLLLVGIILVGSKAFADYSTSGLENPLAHLLLVAFFVLCLRRPPQPSDALLLGALAGLIMLNRLDHGVLVIPALLAAAVQLPCRAAVSLLTAAGAPVAGWLLFSLVYYGFPFPNTFYAKQTTGIPRIEYLERGVGYLVDTAVLDGVTLLGIVFAVGLALWRRRPLMLLAAAAGIVLYVLYVIWIGGDFMGGRMFSAPLVASLAVLAVSQPSIRWEAKILLIVLATGAIILNRPYLVSQNPLRGVFTGSIDRVLAREISARVSDLWNYGITDERGVSHRLWLLPILEGRTKLESVFFIKEGQRWRNNKAYFYVTGTIGRFGYYAGQSVYILDPFALPDAFLSRTISGQKAGDWKTGHIPRVFPKGYLMTKFTGRNYIYDKDLSDLYDKLDILTKGDFFSLQRINILFELNLKRFPVVFTPGWTGEHFGDLFNPNGLLLKDEFSLILGQQNRLNRIFLRTKGEYRLELRNNKGDNITYSNFMSSQDFKLFYFDLEEADSLKIVPLDNSDVIVQYIIVSPLNSEAASITDTPFTVTNLHRILLFGFTDSQLDQEPLWLKNTNRGLPLFLKAASKVPHILEVKATPICMPGKGQAVWLWLNGRRLAEYHWTYCDQPWEANVLIPAEQILEGWNLLEVEAKHGVVPAKVFPNSDDRRMLFVSFQRLWVRPVH